MTVKGGHKRPYKHMGRGQIDKQYRQHCRELFLSGRYNTADGNWHSGDAQLSQKTAYNFNAQREKALSK